MAKLQHLGAEARYIQADVSQLENVRRYVRAALEAFGRIDGFFNNAGTEGVVTPLVNYPEDVFDYVMSVNVTGAFLGLKYVLPVMIAQKSGSVINTASISGLIGAAGMSAYSASKAAVLGLSRAAAGEVARHGVRVNAICPGPVKTPLIRSVERQNNPDDPDADRAKQAARIPTGRYAEADEIANVVVFLASDSSSFVNGAVWTIDGGRTAV